MALLTIIDSNGKEHLIHSSQIAPPAPPPRSTGYWEDVWNQLDAAQQREPEKDPAQ